MNKQYDLLIYIGRFQPPHLAHIKTINEAAKLSEKVLVLTGSANQPRTILNPWTWQERAEMINLSLPETIRPNVMVFPVLDKTYKDADWLIQVQEIVARVAPDAETIKIIGYNKDETSYYLKMFPQWGTPIDVGNIEDINATQIRNAYFDVNITEEDFDMKIGRFLPTAIHDYLKAFQLTEDYEKLVREFEADKRYHRGWDMDAMLDYYLEKELAKYNTAGEIVKEVIADLRTNYRVAPYKPKFVTVDAVVIQAGHILLVRRRAEPGKGLYALPGGFLGEDEEIVDAMIRELIEETRIKVQDKILYRNIKASKVYGKPNRSLRGRTITHAFLIELEPGPLPKVKGSDDADKAKWVPLSVFEKMEDQMFEDHYHIVKDMIGKLDG